jgi:hypothetical protein
MRPETAGDLWRAQTRCGSAAGPSSRRSREPAQETPEPASRVPTLVSSLASSLVPAVAPMWLLTQGYTNTIRVDCIGSDYPLVLIINSRTWSRVGVFGCDLALESLRSLGPVRLA